jgi:hypothetical protein
VADPRDVFAGNPTKHAALRVLWPELFEALAPGGGPDSSGGDGPPMPERVVPCAAGTHNGVPPGARPRAVARVTLNGTPACAACLAGRPGYPLARTDPRTYRS